MTSTHTACEEALGRFGHHPDKNIDFLVEVDSIESLWTDLKVGFDERQQLEARLSRALYRCGPFITYEMQAAKQTLLRIEADLKQRMN